MARKEGSKQELDKQEKLVLERKLVAFRSSLSSVSSYDEDWEFRYIVYLCHVIQMHLWLL